MFVIIKLRSYVLNNRFKVFNGCLCYFKMTIAIHLKLYLYFFDLYVILVFISNLKILISIPVYCRLCISTDHLRFNGDKLECKYNLELPTVYPTIQWSLPRNVEKLFLKWPLLICGTIYAFSVMPIPFD